MSVALAQRWAAVEARRATCATKLDHLMAVPDKPLFWPRVYPAIIKLPLITGQAVTDGLTIDPGETFFVKRVQAIYEATGVLAEDGTSNATLTIPESMRPIIWDGTCLASDTGSNGEWSNLPVPLCFFRGGNVQELRFLKGHRRVRGGSRVLFTINSTFFNSSSTSTGIQSFSGHAVTMLISGVSVRDGVL